VIFNLSVAQRELRLAAHSVRFYRARAGMAAAGLVGIITACLGLEELERHSTLLLGQALFTLAAWIVFVMAAAGFGATADSVSSEKRAGTLGLLFLTHLKGPDIILGKLIAQISRFLVLIVVLFPLLAAPTIVGGITGAQLFRLFISIANMLLFSAAAGMLASTLCVREQVAKSKALQIVLFFAAVLPLLAAVLRRFGCDSSVCLAIDLLSPVYAQRVALGSVIGPQTSWFYISAAVVLLISCGLLAAASWFAPRCWQEGRKKALWTRIAEKFSNCTTIKTRSSEGRVLLDRDPFFWLVVRDPYLRRTLWVSMVFAIALTILADPFLSIYWSRGGFALLVSGVLLFFLFAVAKIAIGRVAVSQIAGAKENGILEAILASHVRIEQIVAAQFRGLIQLLGRPLVALAVLAGATLFYSLSTIDLIADTFTSPPEINEYRFRALVILVIAVTFLFFDAITMTWAGLFCAFKFSRLAKAHSWTGFLALAVPNVLYLVLVPTLLQFRSVNPLFEAFYPPVILWMIVKVVSNVVLLCYSRRWLIHAARQTVTAPLEQTRESTFFPSSGVVRQFLEDNLTFRKSRG
jgi:ABC-type Na+ efflux pump permease subunit